ncbi:heme utilization protein HutZ [Amphritea opalescens]|uniref:Heme utilization protein HutZ n=1 Tax=Amphritea opalescens TaxID=2490544 RepID=A0A430KS66_9GAMM|nr:pyridoxamine 5'-phosphate oxidase family protein [Amphritea opalescens]RTE66310.1 heme utilization protein HutZ [Amphritea opalescens]
MSKESLQAKIQEEVSTFINSRYSLQLATVGEHNEPYASYSPFAIGDDCLYVLLSEMAVHANNLQQNPTAAVMVIADEDTSKELFARQRVNYSIQADLLTHATEAWAEGINALANRHGDRINKLSQLDDFKLFKLKPTGGRYVKGFGRAYTLAGNGLTGNEIQHITGGHTKRTAA